MKTNTKCKIFLAVCFILLRYGYIKFVHRLEEVEMRWYDIEPDVCMAISMIECAAPEAQLEYANFIIRLVKEKDTEMYYIQNAAKSNLENRHTRWYDRNETISRAFSYLKETSKDIQKEVALSVLAYKNEKEAVA